VSVSADMPSWSASPNHRGLTTLGLPRHCCRTLLSQHYYPHRRPQLTNRPLDFTPTHYASLPSSTPTIVVSQGLTGGSHESYVRNVLSCVVKPVAEGGLGMRAVVVNAS
jgi:hypothetical protein